MYNIRTVILGSTPIRTTSRAITARRQLQFNTPAGDADENADEIARTPERDDADTQHGTIDITAPAGTMVFHIEDPATDRSGKMGVVLRTTAGPAPSTLDILWNADGLTTNVLPAKLRLIPAQQFSPAIPTLATPTTAPSISQSTASVGLKSSSRGFNPYPVVFGIIPNKLELFGMIPNKTRGH